MANNGQSTVVSLFSGSFRLQARRALVMADYLNELSIGKSRVGKVGKVSEFYSTISVAFLFTSDILLALV